MESLLEKYTQLNDSFRKKKLTYRIGIEAGFFSEYNNMILAMLYCLENKIHFKLYSKDANFKYEKGWTDYFSPFCKEDWGYQRHNVRSVDTSKRYVIRAIIHHFFKPNTFLTYELWNAFRNRNLEQKLYNIPELGINGNLQQACRILVDLTWRYNAITQSVVDQLVSSVQLPDRYIGFHIRSGDKIAEAKLWDVSQYIAKAQNLSDIKTAFVLADDYQIIEILQNRLKGWDIYTLCESNEKGYFFHDFLKKEKEFVKKSYIKLFASMDILSKSEYFIGTFTANPGMYLGMRMHPEKVYGIDLEKWQIW